MNGVIFSIRTLYAREIQTENVFCVITVFSHCTRLFPTAKKKKNLCIIIIIIQGFCLIVTHTHTPCGGVLYTILSR